MEPSERARKRRKGREEEKGGRRDADEIRALGCKTTKRALVMGVSFFRGPPKWRVLLLVSF